MAGRFLIVLKRKKLFSCAEFYDFCHRHYEACSAKAHCQVCQKDIQSLQRRRNLPHLGSNQPGYYYHVQRCYCSEKGLLLPNLYVEYRNCRSCQCQDERERHIPLKIRQRQQVCHEKDSNNSYSAQSYFAFLLCHVFIIIILIFKGFCLRQ